MPLVVDRVDVGAPGDEIPDDRPVAGDDREVERRVALLVLLAGLYKSLFLAFQSGTLIQSWTPTLAFSILRLCWLWFCSVEPQETKPKN